MRSQVRVTIALESVYKTNYSLHASVVNFRVSAASAFAPTEPPDGSASAPTEPQLFLHCQRTATGTSLAMPCAQLSLELPRRTRSGVTGALLQCIKDKTAPSTMPPRWQATGLRHTTSAHKTPHSKHMYRPYPPFNYKRE